MYYKSFIKINDKLKVIVLLMFYTHIVGLIGSICFLVILVLYCIYYVNCIFHMHFCLMPVTAPVMVT